MAKELTERFFKYVQEHWYCPNWHGPARTYKALSNKSGVYRNRKVYYKLTNTIEEARAFRDEVSQIKSVRYRKQNEILQRFFMP